MTNTPSSPPARPVRRRNAASNMQYRFGLVGLALAIGFFVWYLSTSGQTRQPTSISEARKNQEKIVCPRCRNDAEKKLKCSLCGGLGYIWVDKTRDPGRPPADSAPPPP
jgi:hypothetical protein